MILPGLISLAFYRRRPTMAQIAGGTALTIVFSAALGFISPPGPLGQAGSVIVAVIGGLVLYFGILAYLLYRYHPRHAAAPTAAPPVPPSP